mmetsp:Transcript_59644/g.106346  ORF Transcript_59644/g.106346 Transcript_59644/m.106346 type:complete len:223 (-) Transcript_59644:2273-2941(-)
MGGPGRHLGRGAHTSFGLLDCTVRIQVRQVPQLLHLALGDHLSHVQYGDLSIAVATHQQRSILNVINVCDDHWVRATAVPQRPPRSECLLCHGGRWERPQAAKASGVCTHKRCIRQENHQCHDLLVLGLGIGLHSAVRVHQSLLCFERRSLHRRMHDREDTELGASQGVGLACAFRVRRGRGYGREACDGRSRTERQRRCLTRTERREGEGARWHIVGGTGT